MGGGIAQAYTTMGFCTFMKTVEVTRSKGGDAFQKTTMQVARDIFKKEGIAGINKAITLFLLIIYYRGLMLSLFVNAQTGEVDLD